MEPVEQQTTSESRFFLLASDLGRKTVVEVIEEPTRRLVFCDSLDLNSYQARSLFTKGLLEAFEVFAGTQLTAESHITTTRAIQTRLLRVIGALESTSTLYEPFNELDQLSRSKN